MKINDSMVKHQMLYILFKTSFTFRNARRRNNISVTLKKETLFLIYIDPINNENYSKRLLLLGK